jgi:FkbM family methyltransferase
MLLNYLTVIKQFNVDIRGVIHVGGHVGDELSSYKQCGVENLILFEPQKHCYDKLCKKVQEINFPNATVINKALGNRTGKIEMISDPTGLCGSILNPKLHLEISPDVVFSERFDVDISTLDDEIPENHEYNFLNMDTQGYELEVLKGGVNTLNQIEYIYTEVNQVEVYENNAMIGELDEFLNQYDMERVVTGWHGSQTWGDAFYIKRGLI